MSDKSIYSGFDTIFNRECKDIYRLCFLISRDPDEAHKLTFNTFLRVGALKEEDAKEPRCYLYRKCVILCEDWMAAKIRKKPDITAKGTIPFPFPYEEAMKPVLLSSYSRRMGLGLLCAGFTATEGRKLAGYVVSRKMSQITDDERELANRMIPPEDEVYLLSDQIYDRFSVRNVRVENAIHDMKSAFDHAAPYLAVLVLCFFAYCVWYVLKVL